ncbi:MAG: hypothetical protein ACTSU9_17145 [Promethearchaeota archaeon]
MSFAGGQRGRGDMQRHAGGGSCPREFGRFAYVDLIGWAVFGGSRI